MGKLTTHVLDTSQGCPAAHLKGTLERIGSNPLILKQFTTNSDGRVDGPLLEGESFQVGRYILRFQAGEYFRGRGISLPDPAFLDEVVIAFGISEGDAHYHVPLLLSPYGYSTYRGS